MEHNQPEEKLVEIVESTDGSFTQTFDKRPTPTTQEEYLARSLEYAKIRETVAQQGI